jgi:hypothetical protein
VRSAGERRAVSASVPRGPGVPGPLRLRGGWRLPGGEPRVHRRRCRRERPGRPAARHRALHRRWDRRVDLGLQRGLGAHLRRRAPDQDAVPQPVAAREHRLRDRRRPTRRRPHRRRPPAPPRLLDVGRRVSRRAALDERRRRDAALRVHPLPRGSARRRAHPGARHERVPHDPREPAHAVAVALERAARRGARRRASTRGSPRRVRASPSTDSRRSRSSPRVSRSC